MKILLLTLLLSLPARSEEPTSVKGCLTYCLGSNCVGLIIKVCDKIGSLPGLNDPPPQWPVQLWPLPGVNPTNPVPGLIFIFVSSLFKPFLKTPDPIHSLNIAQYGYVYDSRPITDLTWFTVQSSTDLVSWREEVTVTNYWSDRGTIGAFYRNGKQLAAVYSDLTAETNFVPVEIGDGAEHKFFRIGL